MDLQEKNQRKQIIHNHYIRGELNDAITKQIELLRLLGDNTDKEDLKFAGLLGFTAGDYQAAIDFMTRGYNLWPEDIEFAENIGICYGRLFDYQQAIKWLELANEQQPNRANVISSLARSYGGVGDLEKAREYGEKALTLKDEQVSHLERNVTLKKRKIPPYDPKAKGKNVISFSLWGGDPRYHHGALENARLVPVLYPGWECRIYHDQTVPRHILDRLFVLGVTLVEMPQQKALFEGLFWRFRPTLDNTIDRFLIRDIDSIVNIKERAAVDEWLVSDKRFHIMRDFYTHCGPILAGMWGGVGGCLQNLERASHDYLQHVAKTANCDQDFLSEQVWPAIRDDVLIHDSFFRVFGARPYPELAQLPTNVHVGQSAHVHVKPNPGKRLVFENDQIVCNEQKRKNFLFTVTTGRSGTVFLSHLLEENVIDAEIFHERVGAENYGIHSPEVSHLMLYNTFGNTEEVQQFWVRKFANIMYGTESSYVEISHLLSKGGLIEHLPMLGDDVDISIVMLKRDRFKTAWSLANRFDFYNMSFAQLWYLDTRYPRVIIDSKPFYKFGMMGKCLWYVLEMEARMEYYKLLCEPRKNIHIHNIDLSDITTQKGAEAFLESLPLTTKETVVLPPKANATKQQNLPEKMQESLRTLVENLSFEPKELVDRFIKAGKRL